MDRKFYITLNICILLISISLFILTIVYEKRSTEQIINNESYQIYLEIENFLSPIFSSTKSFLNQDYIIDWFNQGENQDELNLFLEKNITTLNVSAIDVASESSQLVYTMTGSTVKLDPKNERDSWYYNFSKSNDKTNIELYYDTNIGKLYIYYNVKIFDNVGKFLGVFGFLIEYEELSNILNKNEKFYESFIINKTGDIIIHSDQTKIGQVDIYDYYGLLQKRADSVRSHTIESDDKIIYEIEFIDSYLVVKCKYTISGKMLVSITLISLIFFISILPSLLHIFKKS